jgi:hypothetical protein
MAPEATQKSATPVEEAIEHVEADQKTGRLGVAPEEAVVLKSTNDELSMWQTVLKFPKAVFICNLMCIAAAADGYQINLNGRILIIEKAKPMGGTNPNMLL